MVLWESWSGAGRELDSMNNMGHMARCGRKRVFPDWAATEGCLEEVALGLRP